MAKKLLYQDRFFLHPSFANGAYFRMQLYSGVLDWQLKDFHGDGFTMYVREVEKDWQDHKAAFERIAKACLEASEVLEAEFGNPTKEKGGSDV